MIDEQGPHDGTGQPEVDRFDRLGSGFAIAAIVLLLAAILVYLGNS